MAKVQEIRKREVAIEAAAPAPGNERRGQQAATVIKRFAVVEIEVGAHVEVGDELSLVGGELPPCPPAAIDVPVAAAID